MQRYRNIPESFINFDIEPFMGVQNIVQFTLNASGKYPFDIGLLADQIALYPKLCEKIPSLSAVYGLCTPRSFEQASSERIAIFKSTLLKGGRLLDLCGGLGIDDWAFSKSFKGVVSIDVDADLNKLVRRNWEKLNLINISRLDADAYEFVDKNVNMFDVVYLDADRRVGGERGVLFKDTQPNILILKQKLFTFCESVWLKVSPMYDITKLIAELETVANIWVLAERNEVKELLVELKPTSSTVIGLTAVDLKPDSDQQYSGLFGSGGAVVYGDEGNYLIEPSVALIKAGLVSAYFARQGISQLGPNSYVGVTDKKIEAVMGRRFKVVQRMEFSKSVFTHYLKEHRLLKANITKRNFPMEVAAIRKQFKITDGGEDYLFFTTNAAGVKLVYHGVHA